jgi:hypothetical protein
MRGQRTRPSTLVGSWFGIAQQDIGVGAFESIITTRVASGNTVAIYIDNIPQNYRHLQVRITGRSTGPYTYSSVYMRINGDTSTSNYTRHSIYGQSGGTIGTQGFGIGTDPYHLAQNIAGDTSQTYNHGSLITDIFNYSNTSTKKTLRSWGGFANNASGSPPYSMNSNTTTYQPTTAITSLWFYTDGNLNTNTTISLYGIES